MFMRDRVRRSPDGVDGGAGGADLEGDDIRNQLNTDWDKMGGATVDGAPETPVADKPAAEAGATGAADPADAGRERGPDGKFLPKTGEAATGATGTDAPPARKEGAAAAADTGAAAAAAKLPPAVATLPQTDQAAIAKLPAEAQKIVGDLATRLLADHTRKTQEAAELRREAEPILKIFDPYREAMALANQTPDGIVRRWAAAEVRLQRDPVEAVAWIVGNYCKGAGQVEALIGRLTGETAPDGTAVDPQVKPLLDRIAALEGHVNGRARADGEAVVERTVQTIDQFLGEKDATGKSLRPYGDDVLDDMIALAKADRAMGKQPSLDSLYKRAIWANDTVRERMLADQAAAKQEQSRTTEAARVAAARRAGSSVTGSPSPNGARDTAGDIRSSLLDAWDEVGMSH